MAKTVKDFFNDEDLVNIMEYISSHTANYYEEESVESHPSSLFMYGIRDGQVDGQIFYIGNVENNNEFYENLGYQIASRLGDYIVPFVTFISVEAWLHIQDVETNQVEKKEGISIVGLTVDGRSVACHQLIERDDNNLIKIVKTEVYEETSPGYLESFYDGLRNYYVETLDKEDVV